MSKTIRIRPASAPVQYRTWSRGMVTAWDAVFPSHAVACQFIHRAGGTNIRRVGKAWNWTMPDGATAVLDSDTDDNIVTFHPARKHTEPRRCPHCDRECEPGRFVCLDSDCPRFDT